MALTVIQEPQELSFAGNPVIYRIQSNNFLETAGVKFVGALNKSGTFAVGQKITFQFGDNELVEMTAVAAPDDSGYQFKADSGAAITVAAFAAYFRSNYILNKYYDITTSGTNVIFTGRETGSEYNWQSPSGVLSVTTAGVTPKERDNFRVLFDVFFRKNGATTYENIYSEEINADQPFSGIFSIDISKNLNAALDHDIPDFNSPVPSKCQDSKGEYYCQYAEVYGSPAVARKPAQGTVKHVAKGGLSHVGFKTKALLNILKPDAVDASKDLFLKQGSRKLRVRTNQPEFLYFLNLRGHTSLKLKIKIEYTTGLPHTTETAPLATVANDKVCFSTGFDLMNLGSFNPTRTVKQYQCWLVNQAAAVVSETVTYVLDYERREVVRYFCASSSMGGVDTLPAFGKGSEEYEVTQSTAEKPLPLNYELKDGRVTNYDLRIQRSFQLATGFLDKRRFDLLADFFLAEKKYLVKGATALPITVTNQKAGQYKDKQGLITQGIEYRYNHYDHQYTEGDAEEPGDYIEGFFFTSNLGGTFTGAETDPKVGAHIKAITPQQITGWDSMYAAWQSGGLGGGSSSASWGNITGDILNQQDLKNALDGKLSGNVNDWIRNQSTLQVGAQMHVVKGRFTEELYLPSFGLSTGQKARIKFTLSGGSGGDAPPPPLVEETDPIFMAHVASGISSGMISNWNTAYNERHSHTNIGFLDGITAAIGSAGYKSVNDFIKNQSNLQEGAELHVSKARAVDELFIPASGLSSGQKARIKFSMTGGSGGEAPPPPLTQVTFHDILDFGKVGSYSDGQLIRYNATSGKFENWTPNFSGGGDYLPLSGGTLTGPLIVVANAGGSSVLRLNNTTYGSTDSTGTNALVFGWSNHWGAKIELYKQATNRSGFKIYTENGYNIPRLALTIPDGGTALFTDGVSTGGGLSVGGVIKTYANIKYLTISGGDGAALTFMKNGAEVGEIFSTGGNFTYKATTGSHDFKGNALFDGDIDAIGTIRGRSSVFNADDDRPYSSAGATPPGGGIIRVANLSEVSGVFAGIQFNTITGGLNGYYYMGAQRGSTGYNGQFMIGKRNGSATNQELVRIDGSGILNANVGISSPKVQATSALYIPSEGLPSGQKARIKFKTA